MSIEQLHTMDCDICHVKYHDFKESDLDIIIGYAEHDGWSIIYIADDSNSNWFVNCPQCR